MKIETYYESKSFVTFGAILSLIADGFPIKLFMDGKLEIRSRISFEGEKHGRR